MFSPSAGLSNSHIKESDVHLLQMLGEKKIKRVTWLYNVIVTIQTSLFLDQECNFFFFLDVVKAFYSVYMVSFSFAVPFLKITVFGEAVTCFCHSIAQGAAGDRMKKSS